MLPLPYLSLIGPAVFLVNVRKFSGRKHGQPKFHVGKFLSHAFRTLVPVAEALLLTNDQTEMIAIPVEFIAGSLFF